MTIAGRFEAALVGLRDPALAGPELLPVRLARAAAHVLGVDGAGISITDSRGQRIPLGASSEAAAVAERAQFTVGSAPCLTAQQTRQPVFAVEEDLRRRWPLFTDVLFGSTPYRAVVAVPLQPPLTRAGTMDLYFACSEKVLRLDVFEALAVAELVASALSDAAVWSTWTPEEGPEWLHGPGARRRAAVWEAIGTVGVALDLDAPGALELMRAQAFGTNRSVDDVAADLLLGRLRPEELRGPDDRG